MLVSYTVKNYKSFYDEMTLDFRVPKSAEENPYVVKINNDYISKLCLLYGANGAGKSNLLRPLELLVYGKIKTLFDPNMIKGKEEETSFEIIFYPNSVYGDNKSNNTLYTYKLVLDNKNKKVASEIFLAGNKIIFKRENSRIIESSEDLLKNQTIADNTTTFKHIENTSELRENEKIENILFTFGFIFGGITNNKILFSKAENLIKALYNDLVEMESWDFYKHLLFLADTGMEDIEIKENTSEYPSDLNKFLADNIGDKKPKKELLSKRGEWLAPFDEAESDGTKTYSIHLLNIVLSIRSNSLSIHDEFNGLQSELVEMLITLFQRNRFSDIPNSTNQVIISTHDTNLMEIPHLLMEHVWFVNKKNNMSELYSASDFNDETDPNFVIGDNLVTKYKENQLKAKYRSKALAVPDYFLKENSVNEPEQTT